MTESKKQVKVQVIYPYYDIVKKQNMRVGDTMIVSPTRANVLKMKGLVR